MKAIWDMDIVEFPSEEYHTLRGLGWEPFHFIMIPVPPEAMHAGIATPNGGSLSSSFVVMAGMRKLSPVDNIGKGEKAFPSERDIELGYPQEDENARKEKGSPAIDEAP